MGVCMCVNKESFSHMSLLERTRVAAVTFLSAHRAVAYDGDVRADHIFTQHITTLLHDTPTDPVITAVLCAKAIRAHPTQPVHTLVRFFVDAMYAAIALVPHWDPRLFVLTSTSTHADRAVVCILRAMDPTNNTTCHTKAAYHAMYNLATSLIFNMHWIDQPLFDPDNYAVLFRLCHPSVHPTPTAHVDPRPFYTLVDAPHPVVRAIARLAVAIDTAVTLDKSPSFAEISLIN